MGWGKEANGRGVNKRREWFSEAFNLLSVAEVKLAADWCWLWLEEHFFCQRLHIERQINVLHLCTHTHNPSPLISLLLSAALFCVNYNHTKNGMKWFLCCLRSTRTHQSLHRHWWINIYVLFLSGSISQSMSYFWSQIQPLIGWCIVMTLKKVQPLHQTHTYICSCTSWTWAYPHSSCSAYYTIQEVVTMATNKLGECHLGY